MDKKATIKKHQAAKNDTGSPQVQVAIWTERIKHLTEHLKTHKKDNHSRRGLIALVGKRRKMLRYLQMRDSVKYQETIKTLGLRK